MFTPEEIELLKDGLDALEAEHKGKMMAKGLMGAMTAHNNTEANEKFNASLEAAKEESKPFRDRVTLLRAKLIQAADAAAVKESADALKKGGSDVSASQ